MLGLIKKEVPKASLHQWRNDERQYYATTVLMLAQSLLIAYGGCIL